MPKEKLPKLYRRKWINEKEGTAYIVTQASMHSSWRDKNSRHADAEIEIKDCFKQMTLEFYYNNEKQYKQRLKKLNLLINEFMELKQFMLENPPVKAKKEAKEEASNDDGESLQPADTTTNESEPKTGRIVEASAVVTRPTATFPTTTSSVARDIAKSS